MSGRLSQDSLPLVGALLARIALERDWTVAVRVAVAEELAQFAPLAVGQGVHRVDDDRLDASPAATPQDEIHGRHDVGHALA